MDNKPHGHWKCSFVVQEELPVVPEIQFLFIFSFPLFLSFPPGPSLIFLFLYWLSLIEWSFFFDFGNFPLGKQKSKKSNFQFFAGSFNVSYSQLFWPIFDHCFRSGHPFEWFSRKTHQKYWLIYFNRNGRGGLDYLFNFFIHPR